MQQETKVVSLAVPYNNLSQNHTWLIHLLTTDHLEAVYSIK